MRSEGVVARQAFIKLVLGIRQCRFDPEPERAQPWSADRYEESRDRVDMSTQVAQSLLNKIVPWQFVHGIQYMRAYVLQLITKIRGRSPWIAMLKIIHIIVINSGIGILRKRGRLIYARSKAM